MISKRLLTLLSRRVVVVSFFLWSFWLIPQSARGQTYWDVPSGGPSGVWDLTSSSWSPNMAGGGQTIWVNGSDAVFAATSLGATGNYKVTLDASVTVGNLTYQGGNLGSTLQIAAVPGANTITMAGGFMMSRSILSPH